MSTVTDPIADFLTRVRNGARAQQPEVLIPYSKIKAEIARVLKEEGYISDYSVDTSGAHPRIKLINKLVIGRARLQDCGGSAAPGCGVMLARMKFRECLVEWVWRSFPLRAAFCRGAKQESKNSAANCWPTSGDDLTL